MGSLSGLFSLSRGALIADQAALNATANNVANQNTVGYTQQVVGFQSGDTVKLSDGSTSTMAPRATAISARDRVLEHRVQQQTQVHAETSARADVLAQIEDVFSLTGSLTTAGSTQLGTDLDKFFNSLQTLTTNPSDKVTQQAVLNAAAGVASDFNAAAAQLTQVGAGLKSDIAGAVPQVNALTASIASLNGQIGALSAQGDAGVLEDRRQLAIAQLSALVGLDQITTEGNGITLTTQGGTVLVDGQSSFALQVGSSTSGAAILDRNGVDVTAGVVGGSIGGKLAAQNLDLPMVSRALDALAYQVGMAVNAQNQAGSTSGGAAAAAIFRLPPTAAGSAANLAVLPGAEVATAAPGEGATGNGNANALADLVNATGSNGLTITGSLAALLGMVGSSSSALQEQATTQQATLTQLTTQRDQISGVSLDEQAASLSQYEKSYEAAAKLLTVLDKLMAEAINLGTETAIT